jgi:RNA polymerase sigma-70 factor, ECF subfamily
MAELTAMRGGPSDVWLDEHRAELTAHCRRMLRSASDAEDAVQETLVRAWRSYEGFEGRASLRTWLHSIASNVCIDMLRRPQSQVVPVDPSADAMDARAQPDARSPDPAELAVTREAVRRALATALQLLPPRQRAVLFLREVLRWKAAEVAELLGTTVASVNSALQRARATLAAGQVDPDDRIDRDEEDEALQERLSRYVDAFERYDLSTLVSLLL